MKVMWKLLTKDVIPGNHDINLLYMHCHVHDIFYDKIKNNSNNSNND